MLSPAGGEAGRLAVQEELSPRQGRGDRRVTPTPTSEPPTPAGRLGVPTSSVRQAAVMRGGGTECNPPEPHRFGVRVLLGGRPLGAGRKAPCSGPSENSQEARGIRQGKLRDLPSTVLGADCWAVNSCGPWSHSPAWFPVDGRVSSVSSAWTGLEELGERQDRAGRLEPWARVMGGPAARPGGATGPFSK